jgi:prevent-host-death family protein
MSRSASATIAKAQAGEVQIILNHNKPVAAIVDISVLERLRFLEEEDDDTIISFFFFVFFRLSIIVVII